MGACLDAKIEKARARPTPKRVSRNSDDHLAITSLISLTSFSNK